MVAGVLWIHAAQHQRVTRRLSADWLAERASGGGCGWGAARVDVAARWRSRRRRRHRRLATRRRHRPHLSQDTESFDDTPWANISAKKIQ